MHDIKRPRCIKRARSALCPCHPFISAFTPTPEYSERACSNGSHFLYSSLCMASRPISRLVSAARCLHLAWNGPSTMKSLNATVRLVALNVQDNSRAPRVRPSMLRFPNEKSLLPLVGSNRTKCMSTYVISSFFPISLRL